MKKKNAILIYTLGYFLFIFIWLLLLGDRSFITFNDGYNQNYLSMVYYGKLIREFIGNILNGNFLIPQFDFSIGLGEGILPSLNGYGIGDPFLLLSALFPVKYSPYAHTFIILVKIYVCGLSFIYFCRNRGNSYEDSLLGTMAYLGSFYIICGGIVYPTTFLDAMISVPFLCVGIDRSIEKIEDKKLRVELPLILSVAFQACGGFYVLYMVLLFAGMYGLIQILCKIKKIQIVFKAISILFLQVIWGMVISGVILLPAIGGFLYSGRAEDSSLTDLRNLLLTEWEVYWNNFKTMIIPDGLTSIGLFIPVLVVLCIYCAYCKNKGNKDIKIISVIILVLYMNMKIASWVAGGFTSAIYYGRWIFCLCFLYSYLSVLGIKHLKNITKKEGIIFVIILEVYLLFTTFGEKIVNINSNVFVNLKYILIYSFEVLLIYALIEIVRKSQNTRMSYVLIYVALLCGILINMYVIFIEQDGKFYLKTYESVTADMTESPVQSYVAEMPFGRIDIQGNARNEALYIGYNSANEYLSMINQYTVEFYKEYAMVAEMYGSVHHLIGLGGRSGINDMLSVQYYDKVNEQGVIYNRDYLPIGYTYSEYITEEDAEELNALEKNALVLDKVILSDELELTRKYEDYDYLQQDILKETQYTVQCENVIVDKNSIKVNSNSRIVINIQSDIDGEGYFYADSIVLNAENESTIGRVYFGDVYCEFKSEKAMYQHGVDETLICIGDIKKGNNELIITFGEEAIYKIGEYGVYCLDDGIQKKLNDKRRENVLENVFINADSVEGKVSNGKNKILFVGIPYSKGWHAIINDKKVEILRANYGFMAIPLVEGENIVRFTYNTPGLCLGFGLSVVGILVLMITKIREKKKVRM